MSKDIIHIRLRELLKIVASHTMIVPSGQYVISAEILTLLEQVLLSDMGTSNFQALQQWAVLLSESETQ